MFADQRNLFVSRQLLAVILAFSLMAPMVVMSQESEIEVSETATTTLEVIVAPESGVATSTATTTIETPNPQTESQPQEIASDTEEALPVVTSESVAVPENKEPEPVVETKEATEPQQVGEVLGVATESENEFPEEEIEFQEFENTEEEDSGFFDSLASLFSSHTSSKPILSQRTFAKNITVDTETGHRCEAEVFSIDISDRTNATARVLLTRDSDTSYEIEIGSLPDGINVTFSSGGTYRHVQSFEEDFVELVIENQKDSQKGNFTIPIFYTKQEGEGASVVCKINILNM